MDDIGLRSYLTFGTAKITPLFSQIKSVPPGAVLFIGSDGESQILYQYKLKFPDNNSFFSSYSSVVKHADSLFAKAIEKQMKGGLDAGLYLSGGIDSGLIGIYLKEIGVKISAFSSLKNLDGHKEQLCLETIKKTVQPTHEFIDIIEQDYDTLIPSLLKHYKQPYGSSSGMAIANLWDKTPIADSPIVFHGQNSDVINNAMDNSGVKKFGFPVPPKYFKYFNWSTQDMFNKYVSEISEGMLTFDPQRLASMYEGESLTNFQLVAIAGMYLRRTPADGQLLTQPAINKSVPVGNPFYDMDLVEFLTGLSIRHKLSFKKGSGFGVSLDKRVLQSLAISKGLPKEIAYRKKGFNVARQQKHQINFFETLPDRFEDIECSTEKQRFSSLVLGMYLKNRVSKNPG